MSEADTRANLIDVRLPERGWTAAMVKREETAGAIWIDAQGHPRREGGRTDYTLRVVPVAGGGPVAVAIIEAKAEALPPGHGLEQAKTYARRLNVPFAYSTNGHLFVEHDLMAGTTSGPCPLEGFPTPESLRERYEAGKGFRLDDAAARPLVTPYALGEGGRRYYQDAAIRAALEAVAQGRNRLLLSLATGAGKTFIAVHLLKRIADAGGLRRALFVCDRDELRTQALAAFQNAFGANAAPVSAGSPQKNARVLVATYQTLGVDREGDASFLTRNYPEGYFSHIVIDECHRSGFGKWRAVLDRNPDAVQIGLTATPRRLDAADDLDPDDEGLLRDTYGYFGEPVYEYGMLTAFEDGYLAPPVIERARVHLLRKEDGEDTTGVERRDLEGKTILDARTGLPRGVAELRDAYGVSALDRELEIPERVESMTRDLFTRLLAHGGPEQKTIVFCAGDAHADRVAAAMDNLYADWCRRNGRTPKTPYALKVTQAGGGNLKLPDLRGAQRHSFIATTVDLLSTGVDIPSLRNVVFFRYLRSAITFTQMVGRGTRLDPATGKQSFRIFDYTNATRLFGAAFLTTLRSEGTGDGPERPPAPPTVLVHGIAAEVRSTGTFLLGADGRAESLGEVQARLGEKLRAETGGLAGLRERWVERATRRDLVAAVSERPGLAYAVREIRQMDPYDLFDLFAEIAYDAAPLDRNSRRDAFLLGSGAWLADLPPSAAGAVGAIAQGFALGGTEALESRDLFATPLMIEAGGLAALRSAGDPQGVMRETKRRIFEP